MNILHEMFSEFDFNDACRDESGPQNIINLTSYLIGRISISCVTKQKITNMSLFKWALTVGLPGALEGLTGFYP